MAVDEVMEEVLKDRIFFEESGGGVTFSGGEPLLQPEFLRGLLLACRAQELHTAIDTCGFAPRQDLLTLAVLADLILYDLKMVDPARHQEYSGVSSTPILENLEALGEVHGNIWLRIPIIPKVNDRAEDLDAAVHLAGSLRGIRQINLLPYHALGMHKFARVGEDYRLPATLSPSSAAMQQIADRFRALGLPVVIGG
jgi:pyruvate formate lyase activating enzyme